MRSISMAQLVAIGLLYNVRKSILEHSQKFLKGGVTNRGGVESDKNIVDIIGTLLENTFGWSLLFKHPLLENGLQKKVEYIK